MGGGTNVGALMFYTCIYIGSSDGLGCKSFEFRFFRGGGGGGGRVGVGDRGSERMNSFVAVSFWGQHTKLDYFRVIS